MGKKRWQLAILCVLLVVIWLASRTPQLLNAEFWSQWDIFQARKLLEFGFWSRGGALTAPPFMQGVMNFPEDLNYTNHPYPGVWCYTVVYALGGSAMCLAFLVFLRLGSLVFTFLFLSRFFGHRAALGAAFLAQFSIAALDNDVTSNIICVAATLWPYIAWLAMRVREEKCSSLWLGGAIFLASQVSWFFLCTTPFFMSFLWRKDGEDTLNTRVLAVILGGAAFSAGTFVIQFFYYVSDVNAALEYLRGQAGAAPGAPSRGKYILFLMARHLFFLGGGLLLAGAFGVKKCGSDDQRLLIRSALIFCSVFFAFELIIVRFCFVESSPYYYWLFPLSILAAAGLKFTKSRWLLPVCAGLMIPSIVLGYIRQSVPGQTDSARRLGELVRANCRPNQVVLTNIVVGTPPLESWDVSGPSQVACLADRIVLFGQANGREIANGLRLGRNPESWVFMVDPNAPMDRELAESLEEYAISRRIIEFQYIPEKRPIAADFWERVWTWTGRYANRRVSASNETIRLQILHLRREWLEGLRAKVSAEKSISKG